MHGFQFTPTGIVPIDDASSAVADGGDGAPVSPLANHRESVPTPMKPATQPLPKQAPPRPAVALGLGPRGVIKAAKARLREIKRELKRLRALDKERVELERLLDAAAGKRLAEVRSIHAAKRAAT